jgi:hypothetical protein
MVVVAYTYVEHHPPPPFPCSSDESPCNIVTAARADGGAFSRIPTHTASVRARRQAASTVGRA